MNQPKKQHWVPQFYLRYFATPETRDTDQPLATILSKDSADGDEVLTHVRNICATRYLYSPKSASGERVWDLEDELCDLEGLLSQLWPALASDFVNLADVAVRQRVALFVAAMHVRHPDALAASQQIHGSIVSFVEGSAALPVNGTPDVDAIEVSGRLFRFHSQNWQSYRSWGADDHHRFFADTLRSQAGHVAKLLLKKRWSIIMTEVDTFITSGKPVALQHQEKDVFGIATPNVVITFPVSPRRLLVMDDRHKQPANQYYPQRPHAGPLANLLIWRNGSRFMITGRRICDVLQELADSASAVDEG
jgi:hypothetical protein